MNNLNTDENIAGKQIQKRKKLLLIFAAVIVIVAGSSTAWWYFDLRDVNITLTFRKQKSHISRHWQTTSAAAGCRAQRRYQGRICNMQRMPWTAAKQRWMSLSRLIAETVY
ncbi:MAG: hypothetical protein E7L38_01615 [Klebsiella pneumoniae]|nr:hypothetical protein [Klebsiella pneumoniae]